MYSFSHNQQLVFVCGYKITAFFSITQEKTKKTPIRSAAAKTVQLPKSDSQFTPNSFDDLKTFINYMKIGRTIIVDCTHLKEITAIRVLDILSGATYALGGEWRTYGSEVFLFALKGTFGL